MCDLTCCLDRKVGWRGRNGRRLRGRMWMWSEAGDGRSGSERWIAR